MSLTTAAAPTSQQTGWAAKPWATIKPCRTRTRRALKTRSLATDASCLQLNLNKALDKAHEASSLKEISALPPSSLQGVPARADDLLATLKIRSVQDLGEYKFYHIAKAIVTLVPVEEPGARQPNAVLNINKAVDKKWEGKTLREIAGAPVSVLQGLTAEKAAAALEPLGIRTVGDLGGWKYAAWAEAIVALASYESAGMSSR